MKKILGSLTALAIVVSAGAAVAADATGKVTKIGTSSITLSNGQNYQMSRSLSAKALAAKGIKSGSLVKVTYRTQGGKKMATQVVPAMKAK